MSNIYSFEIFDPYHYLAHSLGMFTLLDIKHLNLIKVILFGFEGTMKYKQITIDEIYCHRSKINISPVGNVTQK